MLSLAKKLIQNSKNPMIAIQAVNACVYVGATPAALSLAGKLIQELSPENAKLLNQIPKGQKETVLTISVRRNWGAFVSQLLQRKEIDPNAVNKAAQTPFMVAIQVGFEQQDYNMFVFFLKCKRRDLDLKIRVAGKDALLYCMEKYDELIRERPVRYSKDRAKNEEQKMALEKIIKKFIRDGWFEQQSKTLSDYLKKTTLPSLQFVKKYQEKLKEKSKEKKEQKSIRPGNQ